MSENRIHAILPGSKCKFQIIKGIGKFIVIQLKNFPERWNLLAFNNLCVSKYERLGLNWTLKHEPMITTDQIEYYFDIAKQTGVRNVNWSGLTRKKESHDGDSKNSKGKKLPSC